MKKRIFIYLSFIITSTLIFALNVSTNAKNEENLMNDNSATEEMQTAILSYDDADAIKTVKEYIMAHEAEIMRYCKFVFDDNVYIKSQYDYHCGKMYKILYFESRNDDLPGIYFYLDIAKREVEFFDQTK